MTNELCITELMSEAKALMGDSYKPAINESPMLLFVSNIPLNVVLRSLFHLNSDQSKLIPDSATQMELLHGNNFVLTQSGRKLSVTLDAEWLKGHHCIISRVEAADDFLPDAVCMITPATMALTEPEREWLEKYRYCYDTDRGALVITGLDILHSEKDAEIVRNGFERRINAIGINAPILECIEDGLKVCLKQADKMNESQRINHIKRLSAIRIYEQLIALSDSFTNIATVCTQTISHLENLRSQICDIGNVTASYARLKFSELAIELLAGIHDYSQQIITQLGGVFRKTPEETKYVYDCWKNYEQAIGNALIVGEDTLFHDLSVRMKNDAAVIVAGLNNDCRNVLYKCLSSDMVISDNNDIELSTNLRRELSHILLLRLQPLHLNDVLVQTQFNDTELQKSMKRIEDCLHTEITEAYGKLISELTNALNEYSKLENQQRQLLDLVDELAKWLIK